MPLAKSPQKHAQLLAKTKQLLGKAGYGQGIGQITGDLKGDRIEGRFTDTAGSKIFDYAVSKDGIAYKPIANRRDAYAIGLRATLAGTGRSPQYGRMRSSYLQGYRFDRGGKRECSGATSYPCGKGCINDKKNCLIGSAAVKQASMQLLWEVKKENSEPQEELPTLSPSKVEAIVQAEEEKIRTLPYERAIVVDSKTGKVLFDKKGEESSVSFNSEELKAIKGNVLTHNHPNVLKVDKSDPRYKGFSFSDADIVTAVVYEASEVRAVSAGYRHTLKPPPEGWNRQFLEEKIAPSYQKHQVGVYYELMEEIETGKIDPRAADVEYFHRLNTRVARDTGMVYKRVAIKER